MQHLEVSCAVRRFFKSLGFKGLIDVEPYPSRHTGLASKRLALRFPLHRTQQTVPWPLIVDVWKRRGGIL